MKLSALIVWIVFVLSCGNKVASNDSLDKEPIQEGQLIGENLDSYKEYTEPNEYVNDYRFELKETFKIDLDNDGKEDLLSFFEIESFEMANGKMEEADEPGDFVYMVTKLSKLNRRDTFFLGDGWIKKLFLYDVEMDKPRAKTDYVEIYQSGENNLLILEGYVYGNGATTQTIINVYDGVPELIFNKDERIKSIKTIDEGEIEIIMSKKQDRQYTGGDVTYKVNKWLFPN